MSRAAPSGPNALLGPAPGLSGPSDGLADLVSGEGHPVEGAWEYFGFPRTPDTLGECLARLHLWDVSRVLLCASLLVGFGCLDFKRPPLIGRNCTASQVGVLCW